jgi:hypothetical protein
MSLMKKIYSFVFSFLLVLSLLNGSNIFLASNLFDGGDGSLENPYLISSVEQLENIRLDLSASYALTNDIDLSDLIGTLDEPNLDFNGGKGWLPLGDFETQFSGNFDGRGYHISNLFILGESEGLYGLFGNIQEGKVLNLEVSGNIEINTDTSEPITVGLLAGRVVLSEVANIKTHGLIDTKESYALVGGAAGYSTVSQFVNLENHANIKSSNNEVTGGVLGKVSGVLFINGLNSGHVEGRGNVGGLVGYADELSSFSLMYNYGSVSATRNAVGGIIGLYESPLQDVVGNLLWINYGDVIGRNRVGGLIGRLSLTESEYEDYYFENFFNFGNVTSTQAESKAGGIIGYLTTDSINENTEILDIVFSNIINKHQSDINQLIGEVDSIVNQEDKSVVVSLIASISFSGVDLVHFTELGGRPSWSINTNESTSIDFSNLEAVQEAFNYVGLIFDLVDGEITALPTQVIVFTPGAAKFAPIPENALSFLNYFLTAYSEFNSAIDVDDDFFDFAHEDADATFYGWNTDKAFGSETFLDLGDTPIYVQRTAFQWLYAQYSDPGSEELPETSDAMSWSMILGFLGLGLMFLSRRKSIQFI